MVSHSDPASGRNLRSWLEERMDVLVTEHECWSRRRAWADGVPHLQAGVQVEQLYVKAYALVRCYRKLWRLYQSPHLEGAEETEIPDTENTA